MQLEERLRSPRAEQAASATSTWHSSKRWTQLPTIPPRSEQNNPALRNLQPSHSREVAPRLVSTKLIDLKLPERVLRVASLHHSWVVRRLSVPSSRSLNHQNPSKRPLRPSVLDDLSSTTSPPADLQSNRRHIFRAQSQAACCHLPKHRWLEPPPASFQYHLRTRYTHSHGPLLQSLYGPQPLHQVPDPPRPMA